jgi:hypothetical protein
MQTRVDNVTDDFWRIPVRQTYIWVHRSKHKIAIPHSKSTQYTLSISCLYHFARPGCSISDYFTAQILFYFPFIGPWDRVRSSCLNLLSWVIIVSLLVLDMHEYAALCTSTVQGAETESLCNPWHYFFGQVDWSGASTHMKI